jgi:hypothetical protein
MINRRADFVKRIAAAFAEERRKTGHVDQLGSYLVACEHEAEEVAAALEKQGLFNETEIEIAIGSPEAGGARNEGDGPGGDPPDGRCKTCIASTDTITRDNPGPNAHQRPSLADCNPIASVHLETSGPGRPGWEGRDRPLFGNGSSRGAFTPSDAAPRIFPIRGA